MDPKKEKMLQAARETLQKRFGKDSVNYLGNKEIEPVPRIPSQSIAIDEVTGGGYPEGRIIEVFGGESSGKTTVCLHAIASAQRKYPNNFVGFVDHENSFDPVYAANLGVKVDELMTAQPTDGADAFGMVQGMIEAGAKMVVVDSVAAMVPREEADEEDYGKNTVGRQAFLMSKGLRKLTPVVGKYGAIVIFTNQIREKVGVMFGNPETTSGGRALPYYASIRLKLTKTTTIKRGDESVGVVSRVNCVKNKTAPPFRQGEISIIFGKGIDDDEAVFRAILEKGLVEKRSAGWYSIGDVRLQGDAKLRDYLEGHPDVYAELKAKVRGERPAAPAPAPSKEDLADAAANEVEVGEV